MKFYHTSTCLQSQHFVNNHKLMNNSKYLVKMFTIT